MQTVWLLLLILQSPGPMDVTVPDKPIAPTHGAPSSMDRIGPADLPHGGISLTMKPVPEGVEKMIGVETDTRVYQPAAVQIRFPSQAGCKAAIKATASIGQSVCLEIR
jgi:hypothetical protein